MTTWADPLRSGAPAAASLLINALLLAGLLSLGVGHANRKREAPAMTVMSLAAVQGMDNAEDEQEQAAAEAQQPVEARMEPPAEARTEPPPPPAVQPVASRLVALAPAPVSNANSAQPSASATQAASPASSSGPAQPVAPAPPARRGTIEGLNIKAPAGTSNSYAAKVRSWLYAHKIYPRRAKMRREEGTVRVRFVIDRAGVLMEGVLIDRSGVNSLDDEASAMMRRASPYPKAPPEISGDRIEFVVPIEFTLPV